MVQTYIGKCFDDEFSEKSSYRRMHTQGFSLLIAAGIFGLLFISPMMLFNWGLHYESVGGNILEKLHPATWILMLTWLGISIARGNPFNFFNDVAIQYTFFLLFHCSCFLISVRDCD